MKQIFIIGATSAFAKDVITVLAPDNKIITAGRKGCDVDCDITKAVTIPEGTDVVINFAAVFGGDSDEDILAAEQTNVQGTLNVCIAAKKAGAQQLIIISSIFALLDETSPYYSSYALTKRQADELAQFYCRKNNVPLTILRPSQIYGDSDSFAPHQPFFYQIIDKAERGEDISLYSENTRKNYIHVADLSETIKRTVSQQLEGVYACAYPDDVSYGQIAATAQKVFNKGGKIVIEEGKPAVADNIFPKDLAIYEKIGYSPQVSIELGIQRIKAYRERSHV